MRAHLVLGIVGTFFAALTGTAQVLKSVEFHDAEPGAYAWLLEYAGRPATAAVADPKFSELRDHPLSILKAKADLGDPAGGSTLIRDEILNALRGIPDRIETKLGRYVILSGCRTQGCEQRVFVWVDTRLGEVLSVLLVPASTDLPGTTPNLLIASRQLSEKWIEPSQLPERFWTDWEEWRFQRKLPDAFTDRIVNYFGGFTVLFHEDGAMCKEELTTQDEVECGGRAFQAAQLDLEALLAQLRRRFANGFGSVDTLNKAQEQWAAYRKLTRDAASGLFDKGTYAPVAELECDRRLTHDRTRELNDLFWYAMYD